MASNTNPEPRRDSPVVRALRPVQTRIGQIQEQAAFLAARQGSASRLPENRITPAEVADKRRSLEDAAKLFDASLTNLAAKHRGDSRIDSTRMAIKRLEDTLKRLALAAQRR